MNILPRIGILCGVLLISVSALFLLPSEITGFVSLGAEKTAFGGLTGILGIVIIFVPIAMAAMAEKKKEGAGLELYRHSIEEIGNEMRAYEPLKEIAERLYSVSEPRDLDEIYFDLQSMVETYKNETRIGSRIHAWEQYLANLRYKASGEWPKPPIDLDKLEKYNKNLKYLLGNAKLQTYESLRLESQVADVKSLFEALPLYLREYREGKRSKESVTSWTDTISKSVESALRDYVERVEATVRQSKTADPEVFEKVENTISFLKEEISKIDIYVRKIKERIESKKM